MSAVLSGATDLRILGRSGLLVSSVCIGGSPLGSMPDIYGHEVDREVAVDLVMTAFDSRFRFIDTANAYSSGESERRIGEAIRRRGGVPDDFVIATKVDPDPLTGDFSGARVLRSAEESLHRLGLDHFDLLHLHEPEVMPFETAAARGGAIEALVALRDRGLATAIGVAGGNSVEMAKYVETDAFDVLLTHNRYTLLDRSSRDVFLSARRRGMGIINAAPFGGGMLAKAAGAGPAYAYGGGDASLERIAERMRRVCADHGVSLRAAALQFSTTDPLVDSTVVGMSTPQRVETTAELLDVRIPAELWAALDDIAPDPSLWIG